MSETLTELLDAEGHELDLSAGDISDLLGGRALEEEGEVDLSDVLGTSEELTSVTRRITGQYAEVLARYAAAVFAGKGAGDLPGLGPTLANLRRLSTSTGALEQAALLDRFAAIVAAASAESSDHKRQLHLNDLRDWVQRFSQTLDAQDGERLRSTVQWEAGTVPLLDELRSLRGIGPKRLARLYRAGLYTVEITANALPEEVAASTGIHLALAREVVAASRAFALAERRRCAVEMRERAARFRRILERVSLSEDPEIMDMARSALRELQGALERPGEER